MIAASLFPPITKTPARSSRSTARAFRLSSAPSGFSRVYPVAPVGLWEDAKEGAWGVADGGSERQYAGIDQLTLADSTTAEFPRLFWTGRVVP